MRKKCRRSFELCQKWFAQIKSNKFQYIIIMKIIQ